MKKNTLLTLLFVAFASKSYSQIIASENFDSALDWTVAHTVGSSTNPGWTQVSTGTYPTCNPVAGAGMAKFNSFSVPAGDSYDLTSSAIPFTGGAYRVSFKMYRDNGYPALGDIIDVYYNTTATSTGGTLLGIVNRAIGLTPIESANGWYSYTFLIPGNPNGNGYISLLAKSLYGNNIFVDEIKVENVPTCDNPTALISSNITTSSATIGWISPTVSPANGYEYYYSSTNVTPTLAGIVSGITTANLVGLSPATTYYFWVRSICSSSDVSAWSDSRSFTTACVSVSSFSENFDGVATSTFPTCWGKVGTIGSANLQTTNPSSAPNTLYMYGSGVMPVVKTIQVSNLGAGTNRLKFDMRANYTVGGIIEIGYLTDPNDSTTFIALGSVTTSSLTYSQYVFSPASGAYSEFLALRHTGTPANSVLIDNVVWEAIPSCVEPMALVASNVTSTTTMVSWTGPNVAPANGYQYFISTSNTAPLTTDAATGSTGAGITMTDLASLTPATTYYVWVRSICSTTDSSSWSSYVTFTTACASIVPAYTQDFTTFPPVCWSRLGAGDATTGPTGTATGIWAADGFLNVGTTGAIKVNLYSLNRIGWMISPTADLSLGNYSVSFDYAVTGWGVTTSSSMGSDDSVKLLMSEDNGITWTVLTTFDITSAVSNVTQTFTTNLSSISPNVKFAFLATDGIVDDTEDYDFFIDNFKLDAALASPTFNSSSFSYYPNPVKNTLNLSYSENISDVSVFNLLGQQVIAKVVNANQSQIDMSHLTSGTYMVKITANNQIKTIKVIKE